MDMEVDEDSINVEDLQAQIDLSMAFASNLAASWIKPKRTANSWKKETESELWEFAKRPTRLGVGTSISDAAQHTSREAARLKGQIVGKKRARDAEDQSGAAKMAANDDSEEESRVGAIKRKVKVDPFAPKKKKVKPSVDTTTAVGPPSLVKSPATLARPLSGESSSGIGSLKVVVNAEPTVSFPFKPTWDTSDSAPTKLDVKSPAAVAPDGNSDMPVDKSTASAKERSNSAYLALVTPLSPLKGQLPAEVLKMPLLNLADESGSDDNSPENPSSSPKKKRKRRKKKKKQSGEVAIGST